MQNLASAMPQQDIRDLIFATVRTRTFTADIIAERAGVLCGVSHLPTLFDGSEIRLEIRRRDGDRVEAGTVLATLAGRPKQLAMAEDAMMGMLAKPSGIATAASEAVALAGPGMRIVSGAWKKMPPDIKHLVREAVTCGGASFRIVDQPFLYLDKNFVRMLGGVENTLHAVAGLNGKKVIQLKGCYGTIVDEALAAARAGADILMVDTGITGDAVRVHEALAAHRFRSRVQLAFAKGITLADIPGLRGLGIDILDIGTAIVDAPLLDMKLDVRQESRPWN